MPGSTKGKAKWSYVSYGCGNRTGRDIQSDCLLKQNTEHGFKSEAENKALTAKTGLLDIKKDQ